MCEGPAKEGTCVQVGQGSSKTWASSNQGLLQTEAPQDRNIAVASRQVLTLLTIVAPAFLLKGESDPLILCAALGLHFLWSKQLEIHVCCLSLILQLGCIFKGSQS